MKGGDILLGLTMWAISLARICGLGRGAVVRVLGADAVCGRIDMDSRRSRHRQASPRGGIANCHTYGSGQLGLVAPGGPPYAIRARIGKHYTIRRTHQYDRIGEERLLDTRVLR